MLLQQAASKAEHSKSALEANYGVLRTRERINIESISGHERPRQYVATQHHGLWCNAISNDHIAYFRFHVWEACCSGPCDSRKRVACQAFQGDADSDKRLRWTFSKGELAFSFAELAWPRRSRVDERVTGVSQLERGIRVDLPQLWRGWSLGTRVPKCLGQDGRSQDQSMLVLRIGADGQRTTVKDRSLAAHEQVGS